MTLGKLIEKIVEQKGQQCDAQILTDWVNEIEGQAVEEVINQAEGNNIVFAPYDYTQDAERTLRIPDRFQDVYLNYLYARRRSATTMTWQCITPPMRHTRRGFGGRIARRSEPCFQNFRRCP